jgi:hypothetical protein
MGRKKPPITWAVHDCISGETRILDQFPVTFGTSDDSDFQIAGDSALPNHSTLSEVDEGLKLTPIEHGAELIVDGIGVGDAILPPQDKTLQIGLSYYLLRGGPRRDVESWIESLKFGRWCLHDMDSGETHGPLALLKLLAYADELSADHARLVVHAQSQAVGFFLPQLQRRFPGRKREVVEAKDKAGQNGTPLRIATDKGEFTCLVCWLKFDLPDVMHVASHESLRGDPVLGEDQQQRFHATQFNDRGQALDAWGIPCPEMACPHCRSKLPPGFIELPHHIFSIVGNASAGKSYYLSVLAKELPNVVYKKFGVVWQDGDPAGNAMLNEMKSRLYGAASAEKASLEKTVLGGATYINVPRYGKKVQMPRPFVFTITRQADGGDPLSAIFYDNAGEHFRPDVRIEDAPGALHVAAASGIFFLFDPTRNLEFRRRLSGHHDPQLALEMNDIQDVILSEMKTRIMKTNHHAMGEKIQTPLAVMIGKCDAWMHLLGDNSLYECVGDGQLRLDKVASNSKITRDLLLDICPSIVANAESLSTNVAYFPISSFGHTPEQTSSGQIAPDPKRLRPILLEVPTLWVLNQVAPRLFPASDPTATVQTA